MRPFPSFLLAALLVAPALVRAADVPVVYTVDTTALKLAISGTNLTFQLHTNATCTALAHTQVLTIDATNMQSVLKRSKPKNGVKPPKTTDLRATLTGVAPAAPLYAQVTGTGITPVGGACQVQASTTSSGTVGGTPVLKDANGAILGALDIAGGFIFDAGGTLVSAFAFPAGFGNNFFYLYASTDCTGPKLYFDSPIALGYLRNMVGVDGTMLYYAPSSSPLTLISSQEFGPTTLGACTGSGLVFTSPDRCCCQSPGCYSPASYNAGPVGFFDISGFVPPFSASLQ